MVESNEYLSNDSLYNLILQYFDKNLPSYILSDFYDNGRYFAMIFTNEVTKINLKKEAGFWIDIIIDGNEYGLWQYNRSVSKFSESTKENISYQLSVLTSFLSDTESPQI